MSEKYSFLTFKATRTPRIVESGLPKAEAVSKAAALYDQSKLLSDHGYLASGVTVIVMSDDDAQLAELKGSLIDTPLNRIEYQCGGY